MHHPTQTIRLCCSACEAASARATIDPDYQPNRARNEAGEFGSHRLCSIVFGWTRVHASEACA
jgi:hypothetical protein